MSYDLYIRKKRSNRTLQLKSLHNIHGGTYAIGGTTEAHLNVTYNYGALLRESLKTKDGIYSLDKKDVKETIPILESAIKYLEETYPITELPTEDYWAATPLNVKKALVDTVTLAKLAVSDYPDANLVWRIG